MSQPQYIVFTYELKNPKGKLLEPKSEPIGILEGHNQIFSALEKHLLNQEEDSKSALTLKPEESFGAYEEGLVFEVPKNQIEGQVHVGDELFASVGNEEKVRLFVVDKKDNAYILDGNHPLAGQDVVFDIHVLTRRQATDKEIALAEGREEVPAQQD